MTVPKEYMVFKYTCSGLEITVEQDVEGVEWQEVTQSFLNFLRNVGYVIPPSEDLV